jgi:hypothetical protein
MLPYHRWHGTIHRGAFSRGPGCFPTSLVQACLGGLVSRHLECRIGLFELRLFTEAFQNLVFDISSCLTYAERFCAITSRIAEKNDEDRTAVLEEMRSAL